MKHSERFFIQVRPLDIENYGIYTALILGYLHTASALFGAKTDGKFYQSLKDIADIIGVGLTTMKKYLPTEEMGWKHYAGYKPGTMEKTTWWEPCDRSEPTPDDLSIERSPDDLSNNNKNIKRESERTVASLRSSPTSNFPFGSETPEGQNGGGVVKITTPPEMVSVKKKPGTNQKARFDFAQELLNRMGAGQVKAGTIFCKRIDQLKKQGYDEETLRQIASEAKVRKLTDDFFSVPMRAFSESGVQQLLTPKTGKKGDVPDEISKRMDEYGFAF